jgi:hypothetical protein
MRYLVSVSRIFLLFIATCSLSSTQAQLHWQNVDAAFGPLPPNMHVFSSKDSVDGKPGIAYYVDVLLKEPTVRFTTQTGNGKRYTPAQFYGQNDSPLLVVNGTFFNFDKNQNLNLVMQEGKLVAYNMPVQPLRGKDTGSYYYLTRSAIGIDKHRHADVAWTYTDTAHRWPYALLRYPLAIKGNNPDPSWKDVGHQLPGSGRKKMKWKMQTAIGGGPSLLRQGQVVITNNEERMFVGGEADRHPRTAMGYTQGGHLIILAVQGRFPGLAEGVTLQQEAQILKDLNCWEALNLDGGGSSCLLINGKETIKPSDKEGQRPVPGVFIVEAAKN